MPIIVKRDGAWAMLHFPRSSDTAVHESQNPAMAESVLPGREHWRQPPGLMTAAWTGEARQFKMQSAGVKP